MDAESSPIVDSFSKNHNGLLRQIGWLVRTEANGATIGNSSAYSKQNLNGSVPARGNQALFQASHQVGIEQPRIVDINSPLIVQPHRKQLVTLARDKSITTTFLRIVVWWFGLRLDAGDIICRPPWQAVCPQR